MLLYVMLGGSSNILDINVDWVKFIYFDFFLLINEDLSKVKYINYFDFKFGVIDIVFKVGKQEGFFQVVIDYVCGVVEDLVCNGFNIFILFDWNVGFYQVLILFFLVVGVVYYYLIQKGLCSFIFIVVEVGDVCEVYYYVMFIGYGVSVINLYMAYVFIVQLYGKGVFEDGKMLDEVINIYNKVIGKGLLKIMFKIGIFIF